MIEFQKPSVSSVLTEDGRHGVVTIEPLERGYGTTMGNSIRRVLLASIPGTAVTSIKIDGVLHEFSTIDGVTEDVTEIVLNVKGIVAKLHSSEPKVMTIDVTGPCEVTDADMGLDSDLEIVNPNHHIATVGKGVRFCMELVFEHGRGYVSQDKNKQNHPNAPLGTIFVDSIFTPVYAVSYHVENTRVGSSTDFDKLVIELTTNGILDANEVVVYAADILNTHFSLFRELADVSTSISLELPEQEKKTKAMQIALEDLQLSVRSFNCLKRAGINNVEDLTKLSQTELMHIRNLGKKSFFEIVDMLHGFGFHLTDEEA